MNATLAAAQEQRPVAVVLGVDTHQLTHHAALIDSQGRRLADREFEVTRAGYADLLAWANAYSSTGTITAAGVESLWQDEKKLVTPHLHIQYQVDEASTFRRT